MKIVSPSVWFQIETIGFTQEFTLSFSIIPSLADPGCLYYTEEA